MPVVSLSYLKQLLQRQEGLRLKPYDDATGRELQPQQRLIGKLTIGIGHNLTDRGISLAVAEQLFAGDVADATNDLAQWLPSFVEFNEPRQAALISMSFQLGAARLAKFKQTKELLEKKNFSEAADAMLNSLWAHQTPNRAKEIAEMIRSGKWPKYVVTP